MRKRVDILAAAAGIVLLLVTSALPAAIRPGEDAADVLSAWLTAWRRGDIVLGHDRDYDRVSLLRRSRLLRDRVQGALTPQRELEVLLDATVRESTAKATWCILAVATAERGARARTLAHDGATVRALGEVALGRLHGSAAIDVLMAAARGDAQGDRDKVAGIRIAALRALGKVRPEQAGVTLAGALDADDAAVRLAAADGIGALADPTLAYALLQRLPGEAEEPVAMAMMDALGSVLPASGAAADARARLAVDVILDQIGRGSWRRDLAALDFLSAHRSMRTIPALIDVLARWPDHGSEAQRSGLLRHRSYALLCSLTGNLLPIDRPDLWREFWERERDRFVLAPAAAKQDPTTVAGFFGIPVEGSRVVFVLDVSGSMADPMDSSTGNEGVRTKLDVAVEQLLAAIAGMPPEASFNLVTFSFDAHLWASTMQMASSENKQQIGLYAHHLEAVGGTNLWDGLQMALAVRVSPARGRSGGASVTQAGGSGVDEVFVLSDGAPTSGPITDPEVIVRKVTEDNRFRRVRINTVFLGPGRGVDDPASTETLMRALAEQNGGRFAWPR